MPDFRDFVSAMREQMSATLSRSDALRPMIWPVAICALALSWVGVSGPLWLSIGLGVLFAIGLISYLGAYFYCLMTNPDSLRSESYNMQKLALEHGVFGDSKTGVFPADGPTGAKEVDASVESLSIGEQK